MRRDRVGSLGFVVDGKALDDRLALRVQAERQRSTSWSRWRCRSPGKYSASRALCSCRLCMKAAPRLVATAVYPASQARRQQKAPPSLCPARLHDQGGIYPTVPVSGSSQAAGTSRIRNSSGHSDQSPPCLSWRTRGASSSWGFAPSCFTKNAVRWALQAF